MEGLCEIVGNVVGMAVGDLKGLAVGFCNTVGGRLGLPVG